MRWLTVVLLMLVPLAVQAQARPPVIGTYIGTKSITATGAFTDLTSASFMCAKTNLVCPPGLVFSTLVVRNRDAADSAWLALMPSAVLQLATIRIDAGGALNDFQVLGINTKTISVLGVAGGTDLELVAWFFP